MPLNPVPSFPSDRGYVLRVSAVAGRLHGCLEHINSGRRFVFADADALLAILRRQLAAGGPGTGRRTKE
jgi:hypothetical protein